MESGHGDGSALRFHQSWATVSGLFVESAFLPAFFNAFVYNCQELVDVVISLDDNSFICSAAAQSC